MGHREARKIKALAAAVATAVSGHPSPAGAEPVDPQRIVVVDGDSIQIDGADWRLMGYDTPEVANAWCEAERRLGELATRRLEALVRSGGVLDVTDSGRRDRYKRVLGTLTVTGRDVGATLIAEGYARPYNGGRRKGWCSRDSRDDLVPGGVKE